MFLIKFEFKNYFKYIEQRIARIINGISIFNPYML